MSKLAAKQKLKDLRTKLANLDFEIRALINKGEMEPGMMDAVIADIDSFTSEIAATKKELEKITSSQQDESLHLSSLYNEVKKEKTKSPDEINQIAISMLKNVEIPDYVLADEKLFAKLMDSIKQKIQPQKMSETSVTGGESYSTPKAFKKSN